MSFIDPGQVASLLDRAPSAAVRVAPERCLNRRHKDSRCTLCLACPSGAVSASGTTVSVDAAACSGCGFCYAICPTEAFSVQGPRLGEVLRLAAEWRGSALAVVCRRRQSPESVSTDVAAVLRLPCLAWVSQAVAGALLTAGVSRLHLDDSACAGCPIGQVRQHFVAAAQRAERVLGSMGRPGSVTLGDVARTGAPSHSVPVLDPTKPAVSRRGMFGALSRSAAQAAATVADQRLPVAPVGRLKPLQPAQALLSAASMGKMAGDAGSATGETMVPIGAVGVRGRCTACGLCPKLCPTGALEMRQSVSAYQLEADVSKCLGERCGLCVLICPPKVLGFTAASSLSELAGQAARILSSGGLRACSRCGAPTADLGGEFLCHACKWTNRFSGGGSPEASAC